MKGLKLMFLQDVSHLRFTLSENNPPDSNSAYEIISVSEKTGVCFHSAMDSGSYVAPHWHHAVEIIYLLDGSLSVSFDHTTYEYHAGDCILINADVIHSTKCTTYNKSILFQIPLDFMTMYIPDARQLVFALDNESDNDVYRTKLDIFKKTLIQMQVTNDIRPEGFILRFNSLLFEILFQLLHNFSIHVVHTDLSQRDKDRVRLDSILEYIKQNYNRTISIEEISNVAHLQSGYFCRFFKKCMGITFLEYQNNLRLSYISRDILNTDDSICDILERHGFRNYKLFRRMFHEQFQTTPTEFRKQYRSQMVDKLI